MKVMMDPMEAVERIRNLKGDEKVYFELSEEASAELELSHMKRTGIENLFQLYIEGGSPMADEMNLSKMLDEYRDVMMYQDRGIRKAILDSLGREAYLDYISTSRTFNFAVDFLTNTIIVSAAPQSSCSCGTCSR